MVNENLIPKTETVYELKNEIPSFEEFMKSYEPNRKVKDSYESEIKTSGSFSSTSNHVGFERTEKEEEEVKRQLRKDIRFFELAARNGERIHPSMSGVFQ